MRRIEPSHPPLVVLDKLLDPGYILLLLLRSPHLVWCGGGGGGGVVSAPTSLLLQKWQQMPITRPQAAQASSTRPTWGHTALCTLHCLVCRALWQTLPHQSSHQPEIPNSNSSSYRPTMVKSVSKTKWNIESFPILYHTGQF